VKQFIDDHFAVLVVLTVFVMLFVAYLLEVHWGGKVPGTVDWLEGEMKEVIGAILMGLTGAAKAVYDRLKQEQEPKLEQPK
jgi:hypothetical protein